MNQLEIGHWIRTALAISWVQGVCVFLGGLAAVALWEVANGDLAGLVPQLVDDARPRTTLVTILLVAFVWGASGHATRSFQRDLRLLMPQLRGTPEERDRIFERLDFESGLEPRIAGALGAMLGMLIIRDLETNAPAMFSIQALNHHVVMGIALNGWLFWLMGRQAFLSVRGNRLISALRPMLPSVDLLDPRFSAPFSKHGLRVAFLWLGGSSIASLIYIDQNQDWLTAIVILGTVSLGVSSLLFPVRGAREQIIRAKEQELARVRDSIRSCREELLDDKLEVTGAAAQRIPGLLAYEARIESVREWPLDVPTVVRFGLLLLLAVGSWLGGAVVELLLDYLVDS